MNWINVKDRLPKPFELVWIYWRNRDVLLGCRVYEGKQENEQPPDQGWYSIDDDKCRNTIWWQYYRIDKPEPPLELS
jgi:hypothetical protein